MAPLTGRAARHALAIVLTVVLLGLGSEPARGQTRCRECVEAGAATVALRVPPGTPLAGYGALARRLRFPDVVGRYPNAFWFKPHDGELDAVQARALVVEVRGQRLVWVTADLVAVDASFTSLLARRLRDQGLGGGMLVVSASHTHSGPGAFIDAGVLGVASVDREQDQVRDALADSVVQAVRQAEQSRGPARLGSARGAGPALTTSRLGQPIDREIVILKVVREGGAPVAVLWNYAIHGTMLGPRNLKLSGDVAGLAATALERRLGAPALYVNGAVADVSPARHGYAEARGAADELAGAVAALWSRTAATAPAVLRDRTQRVVLGAPFLSLRNCLRGWAPGLLKIPLGWTLPVDVELAGGVLGDLTWVTIPGELQSQLGETIKKAARTTSPEALVAGVSNGYLGYFLAPDAYARPSYIACASLYGPAAGRQLADAAADLVRRLGRATR